jgi:site-specific DNA-methyltransferase (adenine-specific)
MTPTIRATEADVFAFLKALKGADLNGALTDLPYGTKERFRRTGTTTRLSDSADSSNPWFATMSTDKLCEVLRALYDTLRPNAYAFVYVDEDSYLLLASKLGVPEALEKLQPTASSRAPIDKIGWSWWTSWTPAYDEPTMGTWVKTSPVNPKKPHGGMGYHGAQCTERILCLEKGQSRLGRVLADGKRERLANAFLCQRPKAKPIGVTLEASTPKPISVACALARQMAPEGGTIVDPFIGCGTHALGIVQAGCNALVNDAKLDVARDWWGAYQRGETPELIQDTGGIVPFNLKITG